jgi:prepilin-type N-terminal cleavage/methylation domain-containing protein
MNRVARHNHHQNGFTIVELMLATAILSVILLLVTVVMINISNLYYKGINQTRVQDDVRSITDELAQQLELNGNSPTPNTYTYGSVTVQAICIGTTRYSYVLLTEIGGKYQDLGALIPHILWRDTTTDTACTPLDLAQSDPTLGVMTSSSNGTELIAPDSRLTYFAVSASSPYTIQVGVAYGAGDLLNLNGLNTTCKGNIGDQFCAAASLKTIAVQRISGS